MDNETINECAEKWAEGEDISKKDWKEVFAAGFNAGIAVSDMAWKQMISEETHSVTEEMPLDEKIKAVNADVDKYDELLTNKQDELAGLLLEYAKGFFIGKAIKNKLSGTVRIIKDVIKVEYVYIQNAFRMDIICDRFEFHNGEYHHPYRNMDATYYLDYNGLVILDKNHVLQVRKTDDSNTENEK